ncbi:hypothetical protein VA596_24055 [Amycolatopsis sp., V23-08]|uniref:Uncharacterized protein n=1 Tax=Amycolatopsis heterodermiae TaxID=3110235 RepID=A0ABU5RBN5_9PSEU|nr:hypothetical protein [Amycolatopsis sp., V23-08]MEA5362631.1 hypothetical protein [Amycolatopsis sp., V23-08]
MSRFQSVWSLAHLTSAGSTAAEPALTCPRYDIRVHFSRQTGASAEIPTLTVSENAIFVTPKCDSFPADFDRSAHFGHDLRGPVRTPVAR